MKDENVMIISHGDKGGVGKSIFAALAIEYGLYLGKSVSIVEGDTKIHDRQDRYAGTSATVLSIDLDKSGADAANAIASLFRHVEDCETDFLVLNAPANSHKILDTQSDIIVPVAKDLGFTICTAWMVGIEESSAALVNTSIICQLADRKMAVINRHDSAYDMDFAWFAKPTYRDTWIANGGLVGEIPDLASRVASRLKDHPGATLTQLAGQNSPLHLVDRQIIRSWLKKSWESAVAPLIGVTDDVR